YAETEFEGPPREADQYHRNHPKFLELAEDYIKHVSKVIKPHLVTNGGRIIFCQLDNECSMIKKQNQVLGLPLEDPSSFKAFIKQEYGDWEEAARIYGLEEEWECWDDVGPMPAAPLNEKEFLLYIDTARYLEWYDALFFKRIADMYEKNGINVPFYINSTGPPFPHDPALLDEFVALRTADIYYLKKEKLINMLTLNAKLLKATAPAVVAGEFRCGTFSGHEMRANLYKYQALLWMAYGYHGVNYFMIVERHRWPNTPIDAVGRPFIANKMFKQIIGAYNKIDYPRFTQHSVADINLLWYRPHAFANKAAPLEPGFDMKDDYNNNLVYKSLIRANIPFDLWYPNSQFSSINSHPYLIYAGHDFIEEQIADAMLDYAKSGGTIIFLYNYPKKTITGKELSVFGDLLLKPTGGFRCSRNYGINFGYRTINVSTKMFLDYKIPGDNSDFQVFKFKHMNVGYIRNVEKGRLVMLGFDLTPVNLEPVLSILGWKPALTSSSNILSTLYHIPESDELLLTMVNPGDEPINAYTSLNKNKLGIADLSLAQDYSCESLLDNEKIESIDAKRIRTTLKPQDGKLLYFKKL
ncbi:MAG: hypothetical protein GF364_14235, partial [Candidatus Lokiarchaeota archaeon]|nr:hypothetical protein [Candidatus Lokiarchaeota archaeon]